MLTLAPIADDSDNSDNNDSILGALPKSLVWNPADKAQCEEARARIARLEAENYQLCYCHPAQGRAQLSPPPLPPYSHVLRILDESGDKRLVWSYKSTSQIVQARKTFEKYMKQGYSAYTIRENGCRGSLVEDFDSLLEAILLVPQAPPALLRSRLGTTLLVPPTTPG